MCHYKVTIGIPIYNAEHYVRRALDSALFQTYKNIELLVCDDASTDSSITIVEEYQRAHPRGKSIRLVRQVQNLGIGIARNRILEEAKGKYLFYLDSDDEIFPDTIERLYNEAEKNNAELIYGSHVRIEEWRKDGKQFLFLYPYKRFILHDEFANFVYHKYDSIQVPVWNVLMQIEFLKKIDLHFPPVNFWEDFAATMLLPTQSKTVGLLSDITYKYHCRYDSLSHFQKRNNIPKQEIQSIIEAMSSLKKSCLEMKHKTYFSAMYRKVMMTHFYITCSILRHKNIINPAFTNREIRDIMSSPLSFCEVLAFHNSRWANLLLYIIGILPLSIAILFLKVLAYSRELIKTYRG